jgi:homoserine dehydrogenase
MLKSVERPRIFTVGVLHFADSIPQQGDAVSREVQSDLVRVGLAGCGVVGGALVRLLDESADSIKDRYGIRFDVSSILVRDPRRDRGLSRPRSVFTSDRNAFLANETDIVVEAIGGCDAASDIAHQSLGAGRRFVTANKELIAREGSELASLAESKSTALDFGAAVGGSAPVISLLRDLAGTSTPKSVRGILNGTSNYVLTLIERGASLDAALEQARAKGLAEADCTRDLNGSDAAAKLAIIAWMSFGIQPSRVASSRIGIGSLTPRLVDAARILDGKVRLVAECAVTGKETISAFVEPVVFPEHHAFARTVYEDNRVEVDLGWTSPLSVSGPGAGGAPTATAILGDLLNHSLLSRRRTATLSSVDCIADARLHRWLIATRDSWQVLTATRQEVASRFGDFAERDGHPAIARLELPLSSEVPS